MLETLQRAAALAAGDAFPEQAWRDAALRGSVDGRPPPSNGSEDRLLARERGLPRSTAERPLAVPTRPRRPLVTSRRDA